jgi:outer membrane protein OmpA-like peptidoglycan-associated protein
MITHPAIVATVEGHSAKYNGVGNAKVEVSKETSKDISEHRANIVVEYLVSKGVARNRLAAAAFGQSRRVAYGTTLAGQQENRRVNIIFNYPGN